MRRASCWGSPPSSCWGPRVTNSPHPNKNWLPPAVAAMLMWGFWAFLPKLALQSMQPHSVIFYEAFGNLMVALPVLVSLRLRLEHNRNAVLITLVSSTLTVCAVLLFFLALQRGPVAVIVTMTAMYPIVALVLAWAVLGERLNRLQLAAVCMALGAIWLLASP
ncbi:MAG: EamA family transporter [Alphaproteobacteria bacterium]|nr:EamA family transporter [Alphaproteobacteria bacterium]